MDCDRKSYGIMSTSCIEERQRRAIRQTCRARPRICDFRMGRNRRFGLPYSIVYIILFTCCVCVLWVGEKWGCDLIFADREQTQTQMLLLISLWIWVWVVRSVIHSTGLLSSFCVYDARWTRGELYKGQRSDAMFALVVCYAEYGTRKRECLRTGAAIERLVRFSIALFSFFTK